MGKNKRRPVKQATGQHSRPRKPFWQKPMVWLGSFATLVVGGVLTNVLTTQAQRVIPSPVPTLTTSAPHTSPGNQKKRTISKDPGSPLIVISEDPIWPYGEQVGAWVFPKAFVLSTNELAYLNSVRDTDQDAFAQWLYSHGAYEGGTDTQLVIQNNRDHPIRIIGMDVVKKCQPILTGTLFWSSTAGEDPSARMGFDLDLPDPQAMAWSQGWPSAGQQPYFANNTISLLPGAQQVFNIATEASDFSCSFRFRVTVLDGAQKKYQMIGDGAQPFRVTAVIQKGLTSSKMVAPFAAYKVLYLGGLNSSNSAGNYIRANPKQYQY